MSSLAKSGHIEKAYVRGLKEGRAQSKRKLDEKRAAYNELVIRYKTAKGEIARIKRAPAMKEWLSDHDSILMSKAEFERLKAKAKR